MDEFDFDPFGSVEVIEAISGCPTVDPLTEPAPSAFRTSLDPALVVGHAVPHCVLPQLLRPLVAAFLSSIDFALNTAQDAAACISTLTLEADGVALALRGAAALPHLTALTVQFFGCHALRAEHFAPFETTAPSGLHTVDLSYCANLTDTSNAVGPFSLHQTLTHLTLNPAKCWPGNDLFWTLASDVAAFPMLTELCSTLPFHTSFPSRSAHALERALQSAPTLPLTAPGGDIHESDDGARLAGLGDAMVLALRQFYGSSLQRAPASTGQCELDFVRPLTVTSFESAFQWSLCSVGTRADIVARVIRSADLEETLTSGCVSVATVACIAGSRPFHDAPQNVDERQFEEAARRFILRAHCCACDIIGVLTALLRERTDSVGAVSFNEDETYVLDDAGDLPAAWAMPVVPKRAAHNAFTRLSSSQREVLSSCVRRQEYPGLLIPLLSLGWHTPRRRYHVTSPLSGVLGAVLAFFHGLRKAMERGSPEV